MRIHGSFFGAPVDWMADVATSPGVPSEPRAAIAAEEARLAALAPLVGATASELGLDDYGTFRLAVFAVDALEPADATGRLLSVGAVLRRLGYAAVPLQHADGRVALGVPTSDDGLNADMTGSRVTITRGTEVLETVEFHWLEWNGGRLGDLRIADEDPAARSFDVPLSADDLTAGPRGSFAFFARRLPEFTLARTVEDSLEVYGTGQRLGFTNRPDAAAYLDLYPQFRFPWQAALARAEAEHLGLAEPLRAFARGKGEEELINTLLRTYQDNFAYVPGPLRSLFEMYGADDADCDQMSLLFATSLSLIGYGAEEIRAVEWPHHLGLAIRPRERGPRGGTFLHVDGTKFYLLDLTFYYKDARDRLISAWGTVGEQAKSNDGTVLAITP